MDTPTADTPRLHAAFSALRDDLAREIIGQAGLIERLLIALLADGHLLVEGAPGLAKTSAIRALAARLDAGFARVQFTPDLLPADLTGTEVWRPQDGRFEFLPGPIFHPILLADEINRAPAKVQSALLEAMGERQVTVGHQTYPLPALFLVMARARSAMQAGAPAPARIPIEDVFAARRAVLDLHVAPALERYLVELVLASRDAARYDAALARRIAWGASPRGSIALERCARARAWLAGRDFVTPEDVRAVAPDVLRRRVLPSYEATAEGWDGERLVAELLQRVPLP